MTAWFSEFAKLGSMPSARPSKWGRKGPSAEASRYPGFEQKEEDASKLLTLQVDFSGNEYSSNPVWRLPAGTTAKSQEWELTVVVHTVFLGAGDLKGFWETRKFEATTLVKLAAGEPTEAAAAISSSSATGVGPQTPSPTPISRPEAAST